MTENMKSKEGSLRKKGRQWGLTTLIWDKSFTFSVVLAMCKFRQ